MVNEKWNHNINNNEILFLLIHYVNIFKGSILTISPNSFFPLVLDFSKPMSNQVKSSNSTSGDVYVISTDGC